MNNVLCAVIATLMLFVIDLEVYLAFKRIGKKNKTIVFSLMILLPFGALFLSYAISPKLFIVFLLEILTGEIIALFPIMLCQMKRQKEMLTQKEELILGKVFEIVSNKKGIFLSVKDQNGQKRKLKIDNVTPPEKNSIVLIYASGNPARCKVIDEITGFVERDDCTVFFTNQSGDLKVRILNTLESGLSGFNGKIPCKLVKSDSSLFLVLKANNNETEERFEVGI